MASEKLIPVDYCHYMSDRVRFSLNLPSWVDTTHIGVNLDRMHFLMSLGGISTMHVKGNSLEQEKQIPLMVGFNKNGEAEGAMTSLASQAQLFNTQSQQDTADHILQNSRWTNATVQMYIHEAEDRINLEKKRLDESPSWVPYLDQTVRSSIRQIGTHHLLKGHGPWQKIMASVIVGYSIFLDSMHLSISDVISQNFRFTPPTAEALFTNMSYAAIAWLFIHKFFYQVPIEKDGHGYRLSLFPGYEMDRAALLQLLTLSFPVIKFIGNRK